MALRRLVRGNVDWPTAETVARDIAERYDRDAVHVSFLEADNWLSTPMVVDEELFVKLITPQNSVVHALFTTGRNLGAFSSGVEGFFQHFDTPVQMAEHELEATERMRELGVNAPEPVEAFETEGLGVLVVEYLPEFEALDDLSTEAARSRAPALFEALATMHDAGLAHGDLRAENVLVLDDDLYLIDATSVREDARDDARAYDVACGLAALQPLVGVSAAVDAAVDVYPLDVVLNAREFLDFVNIRPDHDFEAAVVKAEVEKRAS
ncbi:MAG: Mn2+-dependent serine/threonine protein kinase [uncultured archaeon A07HB70]|jgi:Mn2+-dependent serine/threonine protein kinase|nr:MAG: Mn2+-dependent serine/threonine protein kinase [uncultured archaeon A07HB70]